jgi:hypothetical protein
MLALWFWGPTIGLSFLSPHPPEGHRSLPVFAGCAIAIGLALDRIIASWEAIGSLAKRVTAPLALSALAVFLARDAEFYFRDQIHHDLDPWGNQLVRYVTATPIGHHIALLRGPDVMRLSLFFATDLGRRNSYDLISQPSGQIPESRERPQGATYLVHGDRDGWIPLLRALYPNARLSELYSSDPRIMEPSFHRPATQLLMWRALQVPPEDVERHRGLRLTLTDATGRRSEQRTATLSLPQALPADLAYPVRAEWRGWFHPDPHESRPHLRLDTLASSGSIVPTLRIGDLSIDLSAAIQLQLPRGTAPLFASANLTSAADTVRVQWDGHRRRDLSAVQETVVREEIPPRGVLRAFPLDAATSWPDLPRVRVDWHTMDGAFIRREFAPFIADTELPFRAEGQPVIVRFHGEIEVDRRGSYELRFRADGLGRPAGPTPGSARRGWRPDGTRSPSSGR